MMEMVVPSKFKMICVFCGSNSDNRTIFGDAALGGRLRFVKFERRHLDDCLDFIKSKMNINGSGSVAGLSNGNVTIKATGGGAFKFAENLFNQMMEKDVVTWNTMITCYSRTGRMEQAKCLFDEMPKKNIISWTAMIYGYLQDGDVEAAWKLFKEMPDRDIVTWNTMMGGYVRNGMLEDALRLFSKMPERDIVSWNTILQGYVRQDDMVGLRNCYR